MLILCIFFFLSVVLFSILITRVYVYFSVCASVYYAINVFYTLLSVCVSVFNVKNLCVYLFSSLARRMGRDNLVSGAS